MFLHLSPSSSPLPLPSLPTSHYPPSPSHSLLLHHHASLFRGLPTHQRRRRVAYAAAAWIDHIERHRLLLLRRKGEAAPRCAPLSSSEVEELRAKLDHTLQGDDPGTGFVQDLHDAARTVELAVLERGSPSKLPWFSAAWLGIDRNAWVKAFSYRAAVYSFLQAAVDISSRGERRDRDVNIFVQRSLLRLSAPLENLTREALSSKQPGISEWFWSQQYPMVVTSFANILERDARFSAATTECWKGATMLSGSVSDLSLLMLALSAISAVTKLGSSKVSCSQFLSIVPDVTGRLMDLLVDFVPMRQAYLSMVEIGLRREFLLHFGVRAASCRVMGEQDIDEMAFWVDLLQKQLQQAIDRERIWSRLMTSESIEILEKDLAIFGFFIALGRSTQLYLYANGYSITDNQIQSIIRYFIGGSVLYYPQLSSISSYQLYVEVVCEELEWLPFFGVQTTYKSCHEKKSQEHGLPYDEVVSRILDVCSHWTTSFIKYSPWLENPSNIKAARFLSKGHSKLKDCRKQFAQLRSKAREHISEKKVENYGSLSDGPSSLDINLDTFDKALESVEEAINRLEELLQELHLSNSSTGKEHLKAACSDLERIRKLKKEAEFLEASFTAKAASIGEGNKHPIEEERRYVKRNKDIEEGNVGSADSKPGGWWNFFLRPSARRLEPEFPMTYESENENTQLINANDASEDSENDEIHRFEVLRNELIELENRVKRSAGNVLPEGRDVSSNKDDPVVSSELQKIVKASKDDNFIAKSIDKLKGTTTDVLQGTQLLAIDVLAASLLIKRSLTGDELAEKEKKAIQRTLTDLASVVPIGILMLLPVTAVGHAAILAAIQRYMPSLIPSTYGPERLDLLRQLEKVKEIETDETNDEGETQTV